MPDLTPLAFAALGALSERPMHPYEMFQTMTARSDDRIVKLRPGTLYHQVGRLVELGLAVEVGTERAGNRPERTTYAITGLGERALADGLRRMLAQPADEYPEFHLALSEVENLPLEDAVSALEARIGALESQRRYYDDGLADVRDRALAERYWLDLSYIRAVLAAQIEWLRATVGRMQDGDIPWDGPAVPPEPTPHSKDSQR